MRQLNEEQRRLAEQHVRFAKSIAEPIKKRLPECSDEIDGACLLGLSEAACDFYQGNFKEFCSKYILDSIKKEVIQFLRQGFNHDLENQD